MADQTALVVMDKVNKSFGDLQALTRDQVALRPGAGRRSTRWQRTRPPSRC